MGTKPTLNDFFSREVRPSLRGKWSEVIVVACTSNLLLLRGPTEREAATELPSCPWGGTAVQRAPLGTEVDVASGARHCRGRRTLQRVLLHAAVFLSAISRWTLAGNAAQCRGCVEKGRAKPFDGEDKEQGVSGLGMLAACGPLHLAGLSLKSRHVFRSFLQRFSCVGAAEWVEGWI